MARTIKAEAGAKLAGGRTNTLNDENGFERAAQVRSTACTLGPVDLVSNLFTKIRHSSVWVIWSCRPCPARPGRPAITAKRPNIKPRSCATWDDAPHRLIVGAARREPRSK